MQGKKSYTEKLFTSFQLSERVPQDNFYRRLKESLDLGFLYKETGHYYGTEGQKSIDPVVFFKLILMGFLENINSDRKIIEHASLRLDILYLIGYDIDEELPWHSTLSRTRQLYGEELFLKLFRKVLGMCVEKGMVSGKYQAVDSAYVKANASLDSIVEKQVISDTSAYLEELNKNDEEFKTVTEAQKKEVERHHKWKAKAYKDMPGHRSEDSERTDEYGNIIRPKYLSNHTHYSPTDPDARISVKPGKPRQLNYSAQISVDTRNHVICGALAEFADKRDSQCLPAIMDRTIDNLQEHGKTVEAALADAGFSSGEALKYLEQKSIIGYIPNFGQYKPEREGFSYDKENDLYICKEGAKLTLRKIYKDRRGHMKKQYRSSRKDCNKCPYRNKCIGKSFEKKIEDTIDKPYYDRMHIRMQTETARRMKKIRQSTVEPVLGTLLNFLNMKRINTRGIKQANKHILMASIAYNLKKYLNFNSKKRSIQEVALRVPVSNPAMTRQVMKNIFSDFISTILRLFFPSLIKLEIETKHILC